MISRLLVFLKITSFAVFCTGAAAYGQLNYTTNWIGNSFGGNNTSTNQMLHVPDYLDGMYVTSSGEVYTNGSWDEGGRALNIYQNGQIISTYNDNVPDGEGVAADSNYIYASNSPNGTGVTLVVQSTMADASQTLTGSSTLGNSYDIYQLALSNGKLYVAEDDQNVVDVFSTSSYALVKTFSITDPAHIAIDSNSNLWVSHMNHTALPSINGVITDYWGDFGLNTIDEYNSSGTHVQTLTLGSGVEVSALWIDSSNNLYVGDQGANQNILVYDNLSGTPTLSKTLGATGGFYNASTPGVVTTSTLSSATFDDITGIGTDSSGNIYVTDNYYNEGSDVFSYSPSGTLNWQVSSQEFVAEGSIDPTSETDFYDAYHHFKINYANAPGNLGTYYSNTMNPFTYPGDPRATHTQSTAQVQYIQGRKFLLVSDQAGGDFAIYRFNSGSETAVPCVVLDYGAFLGEYVDLVGEPTNGEFIWRDLNGDGVAQSNEFIQPSSPEHRDGQSWWMDTNGDIWQVNYYSPSESSIHIRRYLFQGFDSYGAPIYNFTSMDTYNQSTDFPALTTADRVVFQPSESSGGTLYIAGSDGGNGTFSQVARYDNWETGNRTPTWVTNIPNSSSVVVNSFAETNGYFFIDYNTPHYISVYSTSTGAYVGEFDAGTDVGGDNNIGNDDEWDSISAYLRSNGQYVITKEEDFQGKLLLYVWTPQGTEPQVATPTLSPAGGSYTVAQSVTISDSTSGATIYYTTNGTTPTTNSTQYTGAITVSSSETLEAIATASGYTNSNVGTATYTITGGGEGAYNGPHNLPGTVEASDYDTGGGGVAYNQTTSGGQTGYRSDNSGAVEGNSSDNNTGANGYDLGWTAAGQWYNYTVVVGTAGTYNVTFSVASPSGQTDGFHLQNSSGTNLSGSINVPDTGGWYTWQTVTATVTLPAGTQTLQLAEDNGGWNIEFMTFAAAVSGTQVSLSSVANTIGIYTDGSTFSSSGGLDGGGTAYSASQLPTSTTYAGITYNLGSPNINDVVKGASTAPVITLTSGSYSHLYFLGTGMNGNQTSQSFKVTYTDGTTKTFTQSLSDWWAPSNNTGESEAIQCSYVDQSGGNELTQTVYLYQYSFALNSAKTVKSLTLPKNTNVAVLAITLK